MVPRTRSRRPRAAQAFPAGHFYSPVVSETVFGEPDASRVWPDEVVDPPGLDLRARQQLALLHCLGAHRFSYHGRGGAQDYDPANDQFPPYDAAALYAMVRMLRPRRMVEVGSGWSTTVTRAAVADGGLGTDLTCIEPYPQPFVRDMAASGVLTLREERVEHVADDVFDELGPGDVCFIDSSHVAKTGSDVVHELLRVVPRLADGVVVHVHDIFIPEDYPLGWVRNGFNWNEQYVLQALLIGNARAHVLLANRWLARRHPEAVRDAWGPMDLNGSSFWFVTGPDPVGTIAS
jgi:predicted O-methyltransferase YrrM